VLKSAINPITNLYPDYSHTYSRDNIISCELITIKYIEKHICLTANIYAGDVLKVDSSLCTRKSQNVY
jgi:hypothetical protein